MAEVDGAAGGGWCVTWPGSPAFVLDCIDDVATKSDLLGECRKRGLRVIASLGAALKADPTRWVARWLGGCRGGGGGGGRRKPSGRRQASRLAGRGGGVSSKLVVSWEYLPAPSG